MHPIFDATRATAALMVLVGHALGIFNARHPVWPQEFGVVMFFLLSGYLISQTLHKRLEQPQSTFLEYAVDRWARIYSGFLPAILFVVVLDYLTLRYFGHIAKAEVVTRLNSETFFANLFMLQAPGFRSVWLGRAVLDGGHRVLDLHVRWIARFLNPRWHEPSHNSGDRRYRNHSDSVVLRRQHGADCLASGSGRGARDLFRPHAQGADIDLSAAVRRIGHYDYFPC